MNAKISVFAICIEAIIYLLYNLHDCTFNQDVLKWIIVLLQNQELCVINGGKMMRYFPLKKCTQQEGPILAYLFILVVEKLFIFIKESKNVQGLTIFNNQFLYTAYTDDTTFLLSNENSLVDVI